MQTKSRMKFFPHLKGIPHEDQKLGGAGAILAPVGVDNEIGGVDTEAEPPLDSARPMESDRPMHR